jgi:hypothetical protein
VRLVGEPSTRSTPTMERWLPVVGYEGIYEVSNRGRVKSLARMMGNEPGKRARETSQGNKQRKRAGKIDRKIEHKIDGRNLTLDPYIQPQTKTDRLHALDLVPVAEFQLPSETSGASAWVTWRHSGRLRPTTCSTTR